MENLLSLFFRAASVEPDYQQELCLAAARKGACTTCRDACPHHAIRINEAVEIDDVDCSGCGICVQVCPTGALEPRISFERGMPLRCSQVKGSAQSVTCLGQLQPTDLLRLAHDGRVRLARGECANCPVGSAAVPRIVEDVAERAQELARLRDREIAVELVEVDRFDESGSGKALSRRELFRGGWRNFKVSTADVLAPLEKVRPQNDDEGRDANRLMPLEATRKLAWFGTAGLDAHDHVPWRVPRVNEACIMCPSCTEACPTGAFSRDFKPIDGQGAVLRLDPARCIGCDTCLDACPVGAIRMDDQVTWGELSGGTRAAYSRRSTGSSAGNADRSANPLDDQASHG